VSANAAGKDGTLRADGISYQIGGRSILDSVSVEVVPGEMVGLSGPSGAGKTTLLLLLGGFEKPSGGSIHLGSEKVHAADVGFAFQHFGLIPYLSAAENVSLVLQGRGATSDAKTGAARAALAGVGLGEVEDRLAQDLSGGQQQRVAVARALAGDPYVLIADEPTSELDAENRERITTLLRRHAQRGRIVIVSSDDSDVLATCDRRLHVADRRLAES
jgi:putative ABC transport system ATP-binding protein